MWTVEVHFPRIWVVKTLIVKFSKNFAFNKIHQKYFGPNFGFFFKEREKIKKGYLVWDWDKKSF